MSIPTPRAAGTPRLPSVTVVHRGIPGPRSADPRDRQVYRRLLDLAAMGLQITLVPAEVLPEGGAPRTLRAAGVAVDAGPRETVGSRLARLARAGDGPAGALLLTSLLVPRAHREAAVAWPGPLVIDLDHRPSEARRRARGLLRDAEQAGIDTEIAHLEQIEAELLARADLVIANSAAAAATMGRGGGLVEVVAPSPPGPAAGGCPTAPTVAPTPLVAPARLGDEWATPDEAALGALGGLLAAAGVLPADLAVLPEDTVPRLRRLGRAGWVLSPLHEAVDRLAAAELALDLRPCGLPTTARRTELSAAGVAWVASPAAVGVARDTDPAGAARRALGELADLFVADDPAVQAHAVATLLAEPELRDEVVKVQQHHLLPVPAEELRSRLGQVLSAVGVAPPRRRRDHPADARVTYPASTEYRPAPRGGTLAAADPRIEALEAEMVPLRLLRRDDSINLQSTLDADARYRVFARTHLEAPPAGRPQQDDAAAAVRFSVLVPTYDSDPDLLDACIASVAAQQHRNWVLCLVDDGSTRTDHLPVLQRWAEVDERVHVQRNPWNQGIGLATNDALRLALSVTPHEAGTDHFVALLDHDDVLKADALAWMARYAATCPDYDLWYSDEDKILPDGRLGSPFFKPDWSPELEMGVNYVCHLLVARADLVAQVGGFRAGFDGAQDYDLVLRLVEAAEARGGRIGHVAKPLYSWRMVPGSTALHTGEKPAAHHAGHRALQDALDRRFEPATVEDGRYDTTHRIRYAVDTDQLVTVMIPTRDRVDLLRHCIDRLRDTSDGVRYEVLVVDNDSSDPETLDYFDDLAAEGHQVVRYPHEFSFARQVNLGALHARGDLLLVLNNDTWAANPDWLLRLMEHAQRPEVGLAGCMLMFPEGTRDGRPQHEGIVMGMAGLAYNVDLGGYMGMDQFVRDTSAVTAACVMLRPSVLLGVGGMEERLRVAYNDVDFGLRVGEWGYRVVYTPHAVLLHPESASRGGLHPTEDEEWLIDRWGPKGAVREPFISPQLEWLMPVFYRL